MIHVAKGYDAYACRNRATVMSQLRVVFQPFAANAHPVVWGIHEVSPSNVNENSKDLMSDCPYGQQEKIENITGLGP